MMLPLARPLHDAGFALLFFDARCHGRSDGDSFASLPRFAEDLTCAVNWLQARPRWMPAGSASSAIRLACGAALLMASKPDRGGRGEPGRLRPPATMMRRWLQSMHIPTFPWAPTSCGTYSAPSADYASTTSPPATPSA